MGDDGHFIEPLDRIPDVDGSRWQAARDLNGSVQREEAMTHIFYDLIVAGRGTAAAAFVNTLDLDKLFPWLNEQGNQRVPKILIVGQTDPWAGQRGQRKGSNAPNNKINQPMHMIAQYTDTLPAFKIGGWEVMVDRGEYAKINKEIIAKFKFADVLDMEVKSVDEISHAFKTRTVYGFVVTTSNDQTYVTQRVVLASGAGPHRVPPFLKDALANQVNPPVIMDMDCFGRDATTILDRYQRYASDKSNRIDPKRPMKILIFGPNAALDSVESAGFDKLEITWFVNTDPAILGTNHQVASIAILGGSREVRFASEDRVKVTLKPGTGIKRVVVHVNGTEYEGDILVYGLGQDDKQATSYINDNIKKKLLPLFDENQSFGDMHQSALGFYATNTMSSKLIVFGALSQQVANSIPLAQSKVGYWAKLGPMISAEQSNCFERYRTGTLNAIMKQEVLLSLFEDYNYYGQITLSDPIIGQIKTAKKWLEHPCTPSILGVEWDADAMRCLRCLCVLILNVVTAYTHFDKLESDAANARRKDSKFWQTLLNNPSSTLTASTVSAPQIASVIATGAAINGFMPSYVEGGQVNLNQDDRTILRTYIAASYPLVSEEDAESQIQSLLINRKTSNGNWGFSETDAMTLQNTLNNLSVLRRTDI